jgi:hypothetical protein
LGTAITWLVSFFLVVTTAFAAITVVINNGANRTEAIAAADQTLTEELESSFKLISIAEGVAQTRLDLVLTNNGRRTLADFEDWIITVRYDQDGVSGETVIVPTFASALADNTWTAHSFWIDYNGATAEAIDPGMLNAHEELEIRMQLNPIIESATYVVVTLTSPTGITESITVQAA